MYRPATGQRAIWSRPSHRTSQHLVLSVGGCRWAVARLRDDGSFVGTKTVASSFKESVHGSRGIAPALAERAPSQVKPKASMIPKILHQTSSTLTWEERVLTKNARSLMPDWKYFLWTDELNTELVKKVLPEYVDDYINLPANVARADVARCLYMFVHGGVYFDTDYRFMTALPDKVMANRCVLGIESPVFDRDGTDGVGEGYKIGNAVLASEPALDLWPAFLKSAFTRFREGERRVLYLAGPHALSIFLKNQPEYERAVTLLRAHVLYPEFRLWNVTAARERDTIGIHLCWGTWRGKSPIQKARNKSRRILSAALCYQKLLSPSTDRCMNSYAVADRAPDGDTRG
jgi:Glycosyltransferase sugar-binding region containing DXD motif